MITDEYQQSTEMLLLLLVLLLFFVFLGVGLIELYLFNDYETYYPTDINHARWLQCLRLCDPCVGENRSTRMKPKCLTC